MNCDVEMVVAYFKVLSRHFYEVSEKNHKKKILSQNSQTLT
jgi:hypothetical protein